MPTGPEIIRNYGQTEEEDPSYLFDDESNKESDQEEKGLTPEKVARAWERLSDLEKKFVTCDQTQFDSIITGYEAEYGEKRALIIKALRKLVLAGDPRAGLIQAEAGR